MTVIIANDTPPAIRGLLKRWFIEPKPNVFVGTVNKRTREKTLEFIRRNAPPSLGLLVIATENNSQGFSVQTWGDTDRVPVEFNGVCLIAEKWNKEDDEDGQQDVEEAIEPPPTDILDAIAAAEIHYPPF